MKYIFTCVTITLLFVTSITAQIPINGLVAWYPFSGNANDGSGNGNNGTVTSATLTTDRFGSANSAYSFNGTSSIINANLITTINTGVVSGMTLSGWTNITAFNASSPSTIMSLWDAGYINNYGMNCESGTHILHGSSGLNGQAATMFVDGLNAATLNTWYHVLLTCDFTTNTSNLYINGVFQSQSSSTLIHTTLNEIQIGNWTGGWLQNGKLDDLGVWSRVLTQQEITGVFNSSNCTPNITTGLVASYPFTGNANDVSGNNNNGVFNGATLTTDRFGNPNSAYNFNGTSDFIEVTHSASLTFDTTISISFWLNAPDYTLGTVGSTNRVPIGKIETSGDGIQFETVDNIGTCCGAQFYLRKLPGYVSYEDPNPMPINSWVHLVGTYDGTTLSLYQNDTLLGTSTASLNLSTITENMFIGKEGANGNFFKGKIDDIRIYNRALTDCDVDSLFNTPNQCTGVTASISPQGSTTFCAGGSVSLNASVGSSYLWSNSATTQNITATQTNTYTVTVTNANGCTASASQSVTVNPNPSTPTITPNGATTFCQGGSVTLTSSSANGYLWSNNSTLQSITVSQTNTYTVTVSNANNCTASASQSVTVNSNPATPTITPSGATTFCQGGSVTLSSSSANGYSWSNSSTSQSITVSQTGNYTVTVSNANNCTASASQSVTVNPLPTVTINPLPAFVNNNASPITLTGSPAGGTYTGEGVTGSTFNPSTSGLGNKIITHSYTDGNGCNNSASTTTIVYDTTGIVCTTFDTVTTHITINDTTHITVNDTTFITVSDTTHVTISTTDTLIIDVTLTGLAPPNNTNTVSVFPNPAHDHLVIDNGNFSSMSGYSVKITNALGQIVFNQPITQQQFSIDLNTWGATGTYILYVLDASQTIKATKQIVLQ